MLRSHWGLTSSPFRTDVAEGVFFESPTHEEALARLDFLVKEHRRLGLVIGSTGTGKSLVLDVFAAQMRREGCAVSKLNTIGLEPAEFLTEVAVGLGLNPDRGLSIAGLWRVVNDSLSTLRYQCTETILLVDDADRARRQVMTQIARLAKSEATAESRLTVVLAGRPSRIGRLGTALLELADLRIDLEAWEPAETAQFLETALRKAGRTTPLFAPTAIERLHQLSHGIPRRVSQLADLALVAGAGKNLDAIDADTVESACRELGAIEIEGIRERDEG